jgi:hypothetical protein
VRQQPSPVSRHLGPCCQHLCRQSTITMVNLAAQRRDPIQTHSSATLRGLENDPIAIVYKRLPQNIEDLKATYGDLASRAASRVATTVEEEVTLTGCCIQHIIILKWTNFVPAGIYQYISNRNSSDSNYLDLPRSCFPEHGCGVWLVYCFFCKAVILPDTDLNSFNTSSPTIWGRN